jgi:Flp pilus assembly protein TadD
MTDRKLFHGLLPATALTALVIAGCGSSSSGNSDASFISKVNAECKSSQAQIDALGQPASSSTADITALLKKTLPLAQASTDRLKAITPPADKKTDYQSALDNQDQGVALVKQAITAGDAGDTAKVNSLITQVAALSTTGDALATQIGVTDCVSKSSSGSSGSGTTTT